MIGLIDSIYRMFQSFGIGEIHDFSIIEVDSEFFLTVVAVAVAVPVKNVEKKDLK